MEDGDEGQKLGTVSLGRFLTKTPLTNFDICQVISCYMIRVSWIMFHYKEVHPMWKAAIRVG